MKTIILCGRPGDCCPEINIGKENVSITDDYGVKSKFDRVAWELLKYKILETDLEE